MMQNSMDPIFSLFGELVKLCAEIARNWKMFVVFIFLDASVLHFSKGLVIAFIKILAKMLSCIDSQFDI